MTRVVLFLQFSLRQSDAAREWVSQMAEFAAVFETDYRKKG
jgi:hypothetical protein